MIKRIVREMIYQFAGKDLDTLSAQIKNVSVVSFDVFDTLLKRDVAAPEDVFAIIEQRLKDSETFDIDIFSTLRIKAEHLARQEHTGREITLEEIYAHMPVDEVQKNQLMQMECQTEIELSVPNIPMKLIYNYCISQKKSIYFISDMYLPTDVIQQMLEKNGYTQGKLFVSSESGMTKRSGTLFQFVQKAERLEFHDWVHIGDSIASDFIAPKKLGLRSLLIDREPRHNKYYDRKLRIKNESYAQLNHFIDAHICRYTNPYKQIGYAVLGPMLYGFVCWLEREIPRDETIVFLAREGALLKKAFEEISDRPSVYLRISRRAANLARLKHMRSAQEVVESNIRMTNIVCTQEKFARNYGLSDEEIHRIFKNENLVEDAIIGNSTAKLKFLSIIWPTLKVKAAEQHDLLQRYLEQLHCTEKCAVVDVGWLGTIQALLSASNFQIAGRTISWNGFYMGVMPAKSESPYKTIKRHGYLCEEGYPQKLHESVFNSTTFLDLIFLSTDGSTVSYTWGEHGKTIPVFAQPENDANISAIITSMQNAGLQFVEDIHHSHVSLLVKADAEIAVGNYEAMARIPSLSTIELFRGFKYHDGYTYSLVSEHGSGYYMLHPKQFLRDFLHNGGNKVWFLKSVFKLPLPYIHILNLMRNCLNI